MQVPAFLARWLGARDVSDLGISGNAIRQSAAENPRSIVSVPEVVRLCMTEPRPPIMSHDDLTAPTVEVVETHSADDNHRSRLPDKSFQPRLKLAEQGLGIRATQI